MKSELITYFLIGLSHILVFSLSVAYHGLHVDTDILSERVVAMECLTRRVNSGPFLSPCSWIHVYLQGSKHLYGIYFNYRVIQWKVEFNRRDFLPLKRFTCDLVVFSVPKI